MIIDANKLRDTYRRVELLKQDLSSLYFKMEEASEEGSDPKMFLRYCNAKSIVSDAADSLLAALDELR